MGPCCGGVSIKSLMWEGGLISTSPKSLQIFSSELRLKIHAEDQSEVTQTVRQVSKRRADGPPRTAQGLASLAPSPGVCEVSGAAIYLSRPVPWPRTFFLAIF